MGIKVSRSELAKTQPLQYYAKVVVLKYRGTPKEVVGKDGVILGRVEHRNKWFYTVKISGLDDCYYLPHATLTATGEVLKRSDLYGSETIKVSVDSNGNGHPVS